MLTAAYAIWLALVALTVRWLRSRGRVTAAHWCLWSGFFLALVAFKTGWVPRNLVTFPTIICFLIYVVIQSMRIKNVPANSKTD
jgi:uncharacterized membrane protein YoaK (UPF0700 family)